MFCATKEAVIYFLFCFLFNEIHMLKPKQLGAKLKMYTEQLPSKSRNTIFSITVFLYNTAFVVLPKIMIFNQFEPTVK